jgi:hypothetical protein
MPNRLFPTIKELSSIVGLESFPVVVLVDIGPEMREFLSVCDDLEDYGANLDSIIEEVVLYLLVDETAEESIEELRHDMMNFYGREWSGVSPGIIADAFRSFAASLLGKFRRYGMYSREGLMPYEVQDFLDNVTLRMARAQPLEASEEKTAES